MQPHVIRVMHEGQEGMQGWFKYLKFTLCNLPHSHCEEKNHMIMLVEIEKTFDKIQYPLIKKKLTN